MPNVPRADFIGTWGYIFTHLDTVTPGALVIGICSYVLLYAMQRLNRHPKVKARLPVPIPEQLVVLIIMILVSYLADLPTHFNVPIARDSGNLEPGLVAPTFPTVTSERFGQLIVPSISTAVVTCAQPHACPSNRTHTHAQP